MKKETDIQVQEAQRISNNMNLKRSTPRQMIIKMARVTERILKGAREKQRATNKGFFAKTLQTRRFPPNDVLILCKTPHCRKLGQSDVKELCIHLAKYGEYDQTES